jgi:aspartyl-tRNA(Asn)/glutamyl-tRNA(Gln) amidotransferase subunit C
MPAHSSSAGTTTHAVRGRRKSITSPTAMISRFRIDFCVISGQASHNAPSRNEVLRATPAMTADSKPQWAAAANPSVTSARALGARRARLALCGAELEQYRRQLGVILDHAAKVQGLDTSMVTPTAHPLGFVNAFRPDEVAPSLDRDEVLAQAPEVRDGYFVVPPAMEGS